MKVSQFSPKSKQMVKKNGKRILCFGLCVTGPRAEQFGAYSILALISSGTGAVAFFNYCEYALQEDTNVGLAIFYTLSLLLGICTIIAQLCV